MKTQTAELNLVTLFSLCFYFDLPFVLYYFFCNLIIIKDISNTSKRVAFALKQMKKVMPLVKVRVAVYEKNMQIGKTQKKTSIAPQFKIV